MVKFDTGEFGTRNKKEIASTGEKKEKNTRESVAQKKGVAKGCQAVINTLEKKDARRTRHEIAAIELENPLRT